MSTGIQICNLALTRIGHTLITSTAEPPALDGGDKASDALNALWDAKRDALLALAPWPFAMRRVALDYEDGLITVTGATQADPVVITAAAHGLTDGQGVTFADVGGMTDLNGNVYIVDNAATNTFELWQTDGTGFGAYTSGGTARMKPATGYEYEHALPSACLRVWECPDTDSPWAEENMHLLIDDAEVNVRYIAQETSAALFSASFVNALYLFLAIELAQLLSDSKELKAQVSKEFGEVLQQAMQVSAYASSGPDADDRRACSWQTAGRGER